MIHGAQVRLRPVEERDHVLIHAWQNDPEVWWLMDYEGPLLDAGHRRERATGPCGGSSVRDRGRRDADRPDRAQRLPSPRPHLFPVRPVGERSAWEQGYGTDAISALLEEAFDRFDPNRVELWSTADNERAIHVHEKCGFVVDGRLPERSWKGGAWVDRVVMSVTREGFAASSRGADLRRRGH